MLAKWCHYYNEFMLRSRREGIFYAVRFSILFLLSKVGKRAFFTPLFRTGQVSFIEGLYAKEVAAVRKAKKYISAPLHESISIEGHVVCLHGAAQDFSHTRTVIIAHWDAERCITPYVAALGEHFKSLGYKVILSSAAPLTPNATLERWNTWADAVVYRTCEGYDFTSWKAAFACFSSLYQCEELTLTNDSYFAIDSFAPVYARMETLPCDFWGLTYSQQKAPHLQSYFMVFRHTVVQHEAFASFIAAIPLERNRKNAIAFELSLGIYLTMHGFQGAAFARNDGTFADVLNPSVEYFALLAEFGLPLIKRDKIYLEEGLTYFFDIKEKIPAPVWQSIHEYLLRMGSLPHTPESFVARAYPLHTTKQYETFPNSVLPLYETIAPSIGTNMPASTASVAIALHCFYPDVLPNLLPYLATMPTQAHLYVTTDTEEKREHILQIIADIPLAHKEVRIVPNKGWDMAAFFVGLQDILLQYTYIVKVHAKKSTNMDARIATMWRQILYTSLLGSREQVQRILHTFDTHPLLGVIAPPTYPTYALPIQGSNHGYMCDLLQKKGLTLAQDACIDFPVGGMFWCRSAALKPWLSLGLHFDDFAPTRSGHRDGTLAHALERCIFFGCGLEGLTWTRLLPQTEEA